MHSHALCTVHCALQRFFALWQGVFYANVAGMYSFSTVGSAGSGIFIDGSAMSTLNRQGIAFSASGYLFAGIHYLAIFFEQQANQPFGK
jgi:hypothetical protein